MNIVKSSHVVGKLAKEFSAVQSLIAVSAIALLFLVALVGASEQNASEAQFDAKLKTAAAAVDSGLSEVQKFFPASFR